MQFSDAFKALDAAVGAQKEWAAMAPKERGEILRRAYEAMVERADDLALLMTLEMGKPLAEALGVELAAWRRGDRDPVASAARWRMLHDPRQRLPELLSP